jgi:hypothetical protein
MKCSYSKKEFLQTLQKAARDSGDISEEEILKAIREYRAERKKAREIAVVGLSEKKTAKKHL